MPAADPDRMPAPVPAVGEAVAPEAGPIEPFAAVPAPTLNAAAEPVPVTPPPRITPTLAPTVVHPNVALDPNRLQFHPGVFGGGQAGGRQTRRTPTLRPPPPSFAGVTYPLTGEYLNLLLRLAYRMGQTNTMTAVHSHQLGVQHCNAPGLGLRAFGGDRGGWGGECKPPHGHLPIPAAQQQWAAIATGVQLPPLSVDPGSSDGEPSQDASVVPPFSEQF
jgi:hypothetical protein